MTDCGGAKDASSGKPHDDVARREDARGQDDSHDAPDDVELDTEDLGSEAATEAGPPAPIAFVQTNGAKTASNSVAFLSDVQEGNTLIVALDFDTSSGGTVMGVTDSLGNTYTKVLGPYEGQGATQYVYYATSRVSGPDTVTVSIDVSVDAEIYLHEYSGLALTNTFDVGAYASNAGTSDVVDGMTAGPLTTSSSNELIFAVGTCYDYGEPGTGFTQRSKLDGNLTEDEIVSSPGEYPAVATAFGGAWAMSAVAFHGL
jgi:hypothetical protein